MSVLPLQGHAVRRQEMGILIFDGAYLLSYYKTNRYYTRCVRG